MTKKTDSDVEVEERPIEKPEDQPIDYKQIAALQAIGEVVIIKGYHVVGSASDEDPAIINKFMELPDVPAPKPVIINGVAQPIPKIVNPSGVLGFIHATMFPEGSQPRNVRNVRLYSSREDAVASRGDDPPKAPAGEPDKYLVAWPQRKSYIVE